MNSNSNFKKGLLALAAVLLVSFSASEIFAYGNSRGKGKKKHHKCYNKGYHHGFRYLERLKTDLNLSEIQLEKIFDIGTKYREKYFKNRNDSKKIVELKGEHRKEIEKVLTDKQKVKFNNNNYLRGPGWKKECPYRKKK